MSYIFQYYVCVIQPVLFHSLLDNEPNQLVECIIPKRMLRVPETIFRVLIPVASSTTNETYHIIIMCLSNQRRSSTEVASKKQSHDAFTSFFKPRESSRHIKLFFSMQKSIIKTFCRTASYQCVLPYILRDFDFETKGLFLAKAIKKRRREATNGAGIVDKRH